MFVSAGVGFLHDLVEMAGGQNAFADVKRESLQVSSEAMLARAPEVIIETHQSNWDTSATAREQAVWRTLPALPAVRAESHPYRRGRSVVHSRAARRRCRAHPGRRRFIRSRSQDAMTSS